MSLLAFFILTRISRLSLFFLWSIGPGFTRVNRCFLSFIFAVAGLYEVLITLEAISEGFNGLLLPFFLFIVDVLLELLLLPWILGVVDGCQAVNGGERSGSVLDEEVVHDIGVVSLKWGTIWTNSNGKHTIDLLKFIIIVVDLVFLLFINLYLIFIIVTIWSWVLDLLSLLVLEGAHSKLSEHNVNIIV